MSKMYAGNRTAAGVWVEVITHTRGNNVQRTKLKHVTYHSGIEDDLNWGYGGSGPADLALSILVDYLGERPPKGGYLAGRKFTDWTIDSRAWDHHQDFKWAFVAKFGDAWELFDTQIEKWLKGREPTVH